MNVFFFVGTALGLMIVQTVVVPMFQGFQNGCFDLTLILVLHLSLIHTHYAAVIGLAVLGIFMDSLSGAPFFVYTFSYIWVYILVKLFRRFVFQKSIIFLIVVSMAGVLIQQGLVLFSVLVNPGEGGRLGQIDLAGMVQQVMLGGLLIPPGAWCLHVMQCNWVRWAKQMKRRYLGGGR